MKKIMTTSAGNKIADNQNSQTAGEFGPILMQDYQLLEKLAHQNRERIPLFNNCQYAVDANKTYACFFTPAGIVLTAH